MPLDIEQKIENEGQTTAGRLTADEFNNLVRQVRHNTPIVFDSVEEYNRVVSSGELDEEQIYCIAESE